MELVGGDEEHIQRYRREVKAIFDKVDVDGSGVVEKHEFVEAVKRNKDVAQLVARSRVLSGLVASGDFDHAFSSFDADGGGSVTFDEFWAFCRQEADEENIRHMFELIDADGSRYITHEELVKAFTTNQELLKLVRNSKVFGKLVEENDWAKVLSEMDTDKSNDGGGRIDFPEFWKFCQKVSARVRIASMKGKAKKRAARILMEKKVLNDELTKRLCLHSFRLGAGQGGVFSVSIAPDPFNFRPLPKGPNPYAPPRGGAGATSSAAPVGLASQLRGMTFVRDAQ